MKWIGIIGIVALTSGVAAAVEPDDTRIAANPPGEDPGEKTPGKDETGDRPWAKGVSQPEQDTALNLFKEGTAFLKDAFFTRAVEKYREAVKHWDHPAIHFNLAKALMNLDQPVDAYKHLEASLKYGGKPLDDEQIDQVKRYMKLLYDGELAELIIESKEPDAVVSLNGVELFKAPGKWQGLVKAEKHTILATKTGFQPAQEQRTLPRGIKTEIVLTLIAVETVTKYTNAMPKWIPWTVVGAGAAILGAGGIFSWQSSSSFTEYDSAIEKCNADSGRPILNDLGDEVVTVFGCVPDSATKDKKSSGELFQTLSLVSYIAGGATLATGIVLLYINRDKPVTIDVPVGEEPVTIVPTFGPDGAGVTATMRF